MTITTFEEWYEEHGRGGFKSDELPPIILNPIFLDCWELEQRRIFAEDLWTIAQFLKTITTGSSKHHTYIINELLDRGITTRRVGGGKISDNLYNYIHERKDNYDSPLNEYFSDSFIYISHRTKTEPPPGYKNTYSLYWKGWYFPASMFVFNESIKPSYINWINRNPMEVKE